MAAGSRLLIVIYKYKISTVTYEREPWESPSKGIVVGDQISG